MLSSYVALIIVVPSIGHKKISDPLLSGAEFTEVLTQHVRLDCFKSITDKSQDDATAWYSVRDMFDGVLRSFPDTEYRN